MKINIDITAETIIKAALNRYKVQHESPDLLLSNVIQDLQSNVDSATVIRQAITNSIEEGLRKMERQAMAAESEFERIGQMSLLGDLIPEHKIPSSMKSKSATEVDAWMQQRAQIERDNLSELRAALERQESKTQRFNAWADATRRVCATLERAGIDPSKVTYAEAINQAEAIHAWGGVDAGEATRPPLC